MSKLHATDATLRLRGSRSALVALPLPLSPHPDSGPAALTARSLARRLALALHDLGLAGVLPDGWAAAEGAALCFGDLDVVGADRLVRHLEDLADALTPSPSPAPGPGQATLFIPGA